MSTQKICDICDLRERDAKREGIKIRSFYEFHSGNIFIEDYYSKAFDLCEACIERIKVKTEE